MPKGGKRSHTTRFNQGKKRAKEKRKLEHRKERKKAEEFGTIVERRGRKVIAWD